MSKIKLVPCPTMKKRELNQAIMNGRRFTANEQNFDGRGFGMIASAITR